MQGTVDKKKKNRNTSEFAGSHSRDLFSLMNEAIIKFTGSGQIFVKTLTKFSFLQVCLLLVLIEFFPGSSFHRIRTRMLLFRDQVNIAQKLMLARLNRRRT